MKASDRGVAIERSPDFVLTQNLMKRCRKSRQVFGGYRSVFNERKGLRITLEAAEQAKPGFSHSPYIGLARRFHHADYVLTITEIPH